MTRSSLSLARLPITTSVMPSAKYSWSGSPERFSREARRASGSGARGGGRGFALLRRPSLEGEVAGDDHDHCPEEERSGTRPPAKAWLCGRAGRSRARPGPEQAHDANRAGYVLQTLLAELLEAEVEPWAYLIERLPGETDAAGFREPLEPSGNIDAVAVDVLALDDHVAEVNADAKMHAARLGQRLVASRDVPLDLDGALHGLDNARELGEQIVARRVDDAPAPCLDAPAHFCVVLADGAHGAGLVLRHQPAVGDGVR
jgi:hypothetical protein